mgnify:CR=1 FL=1
MKRNRLYFSFFCLCCFLLCALDVQAQQIYWKGQVKDAVSGEPMIGVSVRVKGTGSGTITDFDGNFTVKASKGDILVISYVGYKTLELDLKNKTTLGVISLGEDTGDTGRSSSGWIRCTEKGIQCRFHCYCKRR